MSNTLRTEVLKCFKSLHRARKSVFEGDSYALRIGREKINDEFRKNKHVVDSTSIAELVKYSREVENELISTVVQAKEIEPGRFALRIKPQTLKLDNVPYKDCPT